MSYRKTSILALVTTFLLSTFTTPIALAGGPVTGQASTATVTVEPSNETTPQPAWYDQYYEFINAELEPYGFHFTPTPSIPVTTRELHMTLASMVRYQGTYPHTDGTSINLDFLDFMLTQPEVLDLLPHKEETTVILKEIADSKLLQHKYSEVDVEKIKEYLVKILRVQFEQELTEVPELIEIAGIEKEIEKMANMIALNLSGEILLEVKDFRCNAAENTKFALDYPVIAPSQLIYSYIGTLEGRPCIDYDPDKEMTRQEAVEFLTYVLFPHIESAKEFGEEKGFFSSTYLSEENKNKIMNEAELVKITSQMIKYIRLTSELWISNPRTPSEPLSPETQAFIKSLLVTTQ